MSSPNGWNDSEGVSEKKHTIFLSLCLIICRFEMSVHTVLLVFLQIIGLIARTCYVFDYFCDA